MKTLKAVLFALEDMLPMIVMCCSAAGVLILIALNVK